MEQEEVLGYCDLHENDVREEKFTFKKCWTCYHFTLFTECITVFDASLKLGVSQSTVRRWIKKGKLKGKLFEWIGVGYKFEGPPKIYLVSTESVKKLKKKQKTLKGKLKI